MEEKELQQQEISDDSLIAAINQMGIGEYSRLQDFFTLSQQVKAKQEAIDLMASDSTPSAIGASYVADTLEPNSQGDLVTLVAKEPGEQIIIDNIYKRLNLPLDKIVYSLFKNAIVIGEFAHEGDLVKRVEDIKTISANESISATEDVLVKVHKSKLIPKLEILTDTTRVFPILQYETVIGFIEITLNDLGNLDFSEQTLSYKDVVIHSAEDYVYTKFGFRTESSPLKLKIRLEDGSIVEYTIDQGRSLLEAAYPAWQTLAIMKDAINLAKRYPKNDYTRLDLFENGLEVCLSANNLNVMLFDTADKTDYLRNEYDMLPIHNLSDLAIKGHDIIESVEIKDNRQISTILKDIMRLVLMSKLDNSKECILKYIKKHY